MSKTRWRRVRVERGIYLQPNGRYAACVMVEGKPRVRTLAASDLAEARAQRRQLTEAARRGEVLVSPRITFGETAQQWLQRFERRVAVGERRQRTLDSYRYHLDKQLLPALGRRRLQAITTDDIAELITSLQASGLAAKTVADALIPLGCTFRFAIRRGYVADSPLRRLEPSERPKPQRREQRVLTREELARLLSACAPRYRALLATAAYTGMRISELLALTWSDVDLTGGVIQVRAQLSRARTGSPARRVPPKTRASVREIPLAPQLALLLRRHKHSSRYRGPADYVFSTSLGTPLGHRNAERRALAAAVARAALNAPGRPPVRFHDLRHTFASHLIIDLRLDVAQVSRILGHASTSITLDTYTHLFDEAAHRADIRARIGRSEFAQLLQRYTGGPTCVSPEHRHRPCRRPRDRRHSTKT